MRTRVGRLYDDQTYHHQALRALHHIHAQGADISEVLATIEHVRAGDADGWYAAWTALGERNLARASATLDDISRGEAQLRAHTYFLRAEFFLAPTDARRRESYARNTSAFYAGLSTLGVPHERISVPYDGHHLNAVYYPPSPTAPTRDTTLVFCGGFDSTLEELYFFLVAAARRRGFPVLTFEGPGQGAVLREQGLTFTPAWERPTTAVLDAFLAGHPRPPTLVNIGLSMGGYLAPRAAAFEDRFAGVVSYDVMFDAGSVTRRNIPRIAYTLRRIGLEWLVELAAKVRTWRDPGQRWLLANGRWTFGKQRVLDVADASAAYTLEPVASQIRQHVLVLAGEDDQFVPIEQLARYEAALVNARSVTSRRYDRTSGGSEHSQLGAATLWQADLFDWLIRTFEGE